jgi:hypothetical protein
MAEYNRKNMIEAIESHARGNIKKHTMNVEIYLKNAVGVGDHPDITETIEKELELIAKYDDQLSIITKYINQDPLKPINS